MSVPTSRLTEAALYHGPSACRVGRRPPPSLNHPNIITIFDFGRAQEGTCYFVMELVNGQSLKQLVKSGGPLTLRRAVGIMDQSARGLSHAHQMGVVHRDIKPHN